MGGVQYRMHGSTFTCHVAPSLGSEQLCAWRLDLPGGQPGTAHRVSHEEVLLVLDGTLFVVLDDRRHELPTGATVRIPAGSSVRVGTGAEPASAWVVTASG